MPSLYERCSFINQENVTLIDYAAFFGSVKCFKYLLMNSAKVEITGKYAIAGGNEEINHLCEQNHSSFEIAYEIAFGYHRYEIFSYLYENKIAEIKTLKQLGKKCILSGNYEIFSYLLQEGMKINDDMINEAANEGNIILIKHFRALCQIPKDILVYSVKSGNIELVKYILEQKINDINTKNEVDSIVLKYTFYTWKLFKLFRTALIWASLNGHTEIVKLLLEQKGIDINAKDIYLFYL